MGIYQDLTTIERIQAKSQRRVDRFIRRLKKRGHVRIGILGMMTLTADFQILKLASTTLGRIEVRMRP